MLVDFSEKKEIYIKHKDGSYTSMDTPYYEVTQLDESTWQIMSSGDYHYLVVGDEMGVAIDTGYGAGNLRNFLEELCGKPVPWVINTHHHFDHSANNCYFDKAFMGKEAVNLVSIPYESFRGMDFFPQSYEKQVVKTGDVIPLGGRTLKIFSIGEHTEDGIGILDESHGFFFSGDEFMPMGKSFNHAVGEWKKKLEPVYQVREQFTTLCGGPCIFEAEVFDIFYEAVEKILDGELPVTHAPGNPPPDMRMPAYQGHKVYDCQLPHEEDVPKGGFFKQTNQVVEYQNYRFQFQDL